MQQCWVQGYVLSQIPSKLERILFLPSEQRNTKVTARFEAAMYVCMYMLCEMFCALNLTAAILFLAYKNVLQYGKYNFVS
jgi:hypothetical protein